MAVHVNCRGASHDDEERHEVGEDAANDHIPFREDIVLDLDALFDHRRLEVELHPRRDGRADKAQQHDKVLGVELDGGLDGPDESRRPVRMGQIAGDGISNVKDTGDEKDFFDQPVRPSHHQRPDYKGPGGHGEIAFDPEHLHPGREPGKLCYGVAEIHDQEEGHQDERHAQTEFLTDQVCQALARHHAHARHHLLHNDERHRDGDQRPQQAEPELRPSLGIGQDAARVVIHVGGDDARSDDRHEDDQVEAQAAQARRLEEFHGTTSDPAPLPGRRRRSPCR